MKEVERNEKAIVIKVEKPNTFDDYWLEKVSDITIGTRMAGDVVNWHLRISIVMGLKNLQDAWKNLGWSLELTENRSKTCYLNFIVVKAVVQQVGYHLNFFD